MSQVIERNGTDKSGNEDMITDKLTPEVRDGMTSENDSSSMNSTDGETANRTASTSDVFTPISINSDQSQVLVSPSDSVSKTIDFLQVPSEGSVDRRDLSLPSTPSDRSEISMTTDDVKLRGTAIHSTGAQHLSSQPDNFQ